MFSKGQMQGVYSTAWQVKFLTCVLLTLLALSHFSSPRASAATGAPASFAYQGRLYDSSGNLLGGTGTDYCFKYSIYDNATVGAGTKLWPAGAPTGASITVRYGVFNVNVGIDTLDALNYNFYTNDTVFLQVEAATKVGGSCTNGDETYETLGAVSGGRQRIVSAPYAINATTSQGVVSADNAAGASNAITIVSGTGTTATGNISLTTGNASAGTAGNIVIDVGTSTASNGSILIGTASRAQTITLGNSTGGAIRVGQNGGTLQLDGTNFDIDTAGTVTIAANQSYTGAGAVTLSSGGAAGLTINSASGRVTVATGDFLNTSVAGVAGAAAGDIWYDSTANKYKINENGTTKIVCNTTDAGCGSGGATTLKNAYDADVDGTDATVALTNTDGSIIFQNPSSSGTTSGYILKLDQLATGAVDGLQISNAGTGNGLLVNAISTGNLVDLQKSSVSKFTVANSGALTINGTDNSAIRTTTGTGTGPTDFGLSGAVFRNVTNANDQIELDDGTVASNGTITVGATQPALDAAVGAGAHAIQRADGKYLIIKGASSLATSLYDPIAQTFTNSQALVVGAGTVGAGSLALPRPNGMYTVVLGNGVVNTSLVDPMGVVTAVAGTSLTAAAGSGTSAFKRPDGRYLVVLGGAIGTTNIYDPVANTFVAGPTGSAVTWGTGSLILPRPNGDALVIVGTALSSTQNYTSMTGTITGSGPVGSFAAGPNLPTGCEINNAGSIAIRKSDGKYIVLSKVNASAIYDPVANTWSQNAGSCTTPTAGKGPTVALADGAHAVPLQDGRYLILIGGSSPVANIYDPSTDTFTAHATAVTAGGAGRFSLMNPDGTWLLVAGAASSGTNCVTAGTCTNNYDTSLATTGVYQSDDISTATLTATSTLRWTSQFEVPFTGLSTGAGGALAMTATQSAGGGSCTAGVHKYIATFMINGVETLGSPVSNSVTCSGGTDKVVLTNVPIGPAGTTARKIYRAGDASAAVTKFQLVNGGSPTCVFTENTTTTCTDTLADASLTTTLATGTGLIQNGGLSTIRFFVRTAVNSSGCTTPLNSAIDRELQNSGDYIRAGLTDNCVRITIKFIRPIPKRIIDDRGTWYGNGNTVTRFDYVTPSLFDVMVENSTVLRKSGLEFALPNASFNNPAQAAPAALTAGAPSSGGSCTAGTHTWKYTNVISANPASATGPFTESLPSAVSAMQTCTGGNGTVALSVIAAGPTGTTARKVYRTLANDTSNYYLLTTINDNSTTTFNDTVADASLGAALAGSSASGPILTRVVSSTNTLNPGSIYLPPGGLVPTSQSGTNGFYTGLTSGAHPTITGAQTNDGTIVIARPNRTFKIIASLTTPAANGSLYDPGGETFSAAQAAPNIPTAANGLGGFSLKRPDGKFLVVLGNATGTTNIYDPVADTFVAGPSLSQSAVAGCGAFTMPNIDGTYTIMHGTSAAACAVSAVVTSSVYDPVRNTMVAGPTLTTTVNCGAWAIPMQFPGRHIYKVFVGAPAATVGVLTTMNYNAETKVFTAGTALVTNNHGCGSFAFQRQDGFWISVAAGGGTAGAGLATTNIINPYTGTNAVGPTVTGLAQRGAHVIPRPDGTFLILHGGALTTSSIYQPWGGTFQVGADIGVASVAGPTMVATGAGSLSFQRPDGKWILINGNATNATQLVDAGWYPDGQYLSEQMQVPALAANSTLEWKQSADNFIRMEIRVASSQAALGTTARRSVGKPGQSFFNTGGETWVQVEVNMRRDFPTFGGTLDGVYNTGGGMTYLNRPVSIPTLFSYQINNGMDLLTLQAGGNNLLRVTSNGNVYSSSSGGFYSGGADLAENYTSTQELGLGEVVALDPDVTAGVIRSTGAYQQTLLGVVSTAPGFVAGAFTEDSYPIALVGRVPIKVTTENGTIKAGDALTSSSRPGYAMKATQSGRVLGRALESFVDSSADYCAADDNGKTNLKPAKCGTLIVFVNLVDFYGVPVEVAMAEAHSSLGVTADTVAADNVVVAGASDTQAQIINYLKSLKAESSTPPSEIFTGRLSASSDILSPQVVADLVSAQTVKTQNLAVLDDLAIKNLQASGAVTFGGAATFKADTVFERLTTFLGDVVFKGKALFTKPPIQSPDSAGFAIIEEGSDQVTVLFDEPYNQAPVTQVSLIGLSSTDPISPLSDPAADKALLEKNYSYLVASPTTQGFTILLNKPAEQDLQFAWSAADVKDARTSRNQPSPASLSPSPILDPH